MSFWFKPRQVIFMDAQSAKPARNVRMSYFTMLLIFLVLTVGSFAFGSWYAPFHSIQEIIPENIKLKRQNAELVREIADMNTLNSLKDEQMNSLKEQLTEQENEIVRITKQLQMFDSILDERKGKGINILEHKAFWGINKRINWKALFIKGGSYPRFLIGKYELFALDDKGNILSLTKTMLKYRVESHNLLQQKFEWAEEWQPTKVELVVYNSRRKEVLRKTIPIQGN